MCPQKLIGVAFLFCSMVLMIPPPEGRAHEPITTKVTFTKEIVRILQQNCLGCHRPGGIAPMSLATYEAARPWAKAIKEEVLGKRMPPWPAVKGYGEFRNAPPLTLRDIDLIVNWVEGGAPQGDPKDLPEGPLFSDGWSLGPPDLILRPDRERAVAPESDEYGRFVLPTNLKKDRWITAVDLRPGNGSVVHCATFYVDNERSSQNARARGVKAAGRKPSTTPTPGPPPPTPDTLGTWVPGQKAVALPDGVARRLPAGSRIVVRIHYRGSRAATKDRSAVGLYFAKTVVRKPLYEAAITNANAVIAAGVARQPVKAHFTVKSDAEAIAIRPCVHPLVISLEATAYRPDGTVEVLLWTRGQRFDWRPTYYVKRPVALPKGTRVEVTTYFDSSAHNPNHPNLLPNAMRWSELSADPFCAVLMTTRSAER